MMFFGTEKETWPPDESLERLERYREYRNLFKGKHQEVFKRIDLWLNRKADKTIIYIVVNFAGLISKICADLLFGEPLQFTLGKDGSPEQEAIDRLVERNQLHITNYEMALSSSWRGDSVMKVRFGKRRSWETENEVIIETVSPQHFFPELNGDNVKEMLSATLAWIKESEQKDVMGRKKRYLRKEIHEPGLIRNELWEMDGNHIRKRVSLKTLPEYTELEDQQETGFPGLLVEYVPNWRLDDEFWGLSDYTDLPSLFDALNNRMSKIDTILDDHSDPKLILPPGSMKHDPRTDRYYIDKEDMGAMEIGHDIESRDLPRYLIWDAKLEAAFAQIDKMLDMLMMVSEVSPAAFGLDKQGIADSGRALKFRLVRTLAKINRKKLYFDQALKNVLYAAQVLDTVHGKGSYTPDYPHITWADGLPDDPLEQADIEATRITSGTTSLESAIRRLDGLQGKDLQDEKKRIQEDKQFNRPASPEEGITTRFRLPNIDFSKGGQ